MENFKNGYQSKQPVSVVLLWPFSAEVMGGKVVLMQPRLN